MKRRPTLPGEILKKEYMEPLGITVTQLSERAKIKPSTVSRILAGKTTVTVLTALKLGRLFNTSSDFWLNLQRAVDIYDTMAYKEVAAEINSVKPFIESNENALNKLSQFHVPIDVPTTIKTIALPFINGIIIDGKYIPTDPTNHERFLKQENLYVWGAELTLGGATIKVVADFDSKIVLATGTGFETLVLGNAG